MSSLLNGKYPLIYESMQGFVRQKRFNDAVALLDCVRSLTDEEAEELRDAIHLQGEPARIAAQARRDRLNTLGTPLERARVKKERLGIVFGREPSLREIANSLVAEKDFEAATYNIMKEV